jgi:hypothetical protein
MSHDHMTFGHLAVLGLRIFGAAGSRSPELQHANRPPTQVDQHPVITGRETHRCSQFGPSPHRVRPSAFSANPQDHLTGDD